MSNRLRYPRTTITPQVGDTVRFWDDSETMTIEEVIATENIRKKWGLKEDGIMMISPKYGRIFDTLDNHSEVELVERKKK